MKRLSFAIALAAAFAVPAAALAQPVTVASPPESTMTVQGAGVVERSPDLARLSLSIVTNDDSAVVSSSRNNDVYNTLKSRLNGLGIADDAIRTSSYNVTFVPHPPRGLPPEQQQPRYGYITTRYLSVTVTPIENLGKAIDAATAAGVTNVGNVSFDLKDRKTQYRAALAAAMADAKATADTVAAAGGFSIVRVRSVNVGYSGIPLQAPAPAPPMMRMAAATPTDIQP
ncbi:MAG: SIMPL domain-containing protein, partial [Candidatus Eremiobacteraeota bacterium]|nr:SIMPL domain-containing protein [Candidatus Eremiobacteraeota bacterium]